jgi:hypothetical protein
MVGHLKSRELVRVVRSEFQVQISAGAQDLRHSISAELADVLVRRGHAVPHIHEVESTAGGEISQ